MYIKGNNRANFLFAQALLGSAALAIIRLQHHLSKIEIKKIKIDIITIEIITNFDSKLNCVNFMHLRNV